MTDTTREPEPAAPEATVARPRRRHRGRRLGVLLATLFGLLVVTFVIGRIIPVDPVLAVVGDRASTETYEAAREAMGLDRPLVVQFLIYVRGLVTGDLGVSTVTGRPVAADIARYFPATIELATLATLIGLALGVPIGVIAAAHRNRGLDHVLRVVALIGYSAPTFWLGMIALLIFYAVLGWSAGPGRLDVHLEGVAPTITGFLLIDSLVSGSWAVFRNALAHMILPALVLGYFSMAYIARMTRSFMIEELGRDYILAARAKGLSERRILWRHALGNAAVPLITVAALTYGGLLEGSVLTETVFAWPGLGAYLTHSLLKADMNAVLGATLVIGIVFVLLNMLADSLYRYADPRAR